VHWREVQKEKSRLNKNIVYTRQWYDRNLEKKKKENQANLRNLLAMAD
jgi:hypothetical protein